MVLWMKNEHLGLFLTRAQPSADVRMVAKATATICLTGDHSFLLLICYQETLIHLWYILKEHFRSEFADELFLCRKFCQPCPQFDGVDIVLVNPLRGVQRQLGGMVFNARLLYVDLSSCLSTVGAVQVNCQSLKKVKTIILF